MLMKALSLKQPWAYGVIYLDKRFENREWQTSNMNRKFRGTFLMHASKSCTKEDQKAYEDMLWMGEHYGLVERSKLLQVPEFGKLERGGIIGVADVIGAVTESDMNQRAKHPSRHWFWGSFALELANVKPLPFTPCNGMLGFFGVDTTVLGLDAAIIAAAKNHITPPVYAG